jgi:hypothetical protein
MRGNRRKAISERNEKIKKECVRFQKRKIGI